MRGIVYADHSATTYVKDEVLEEMLPYFCDRFGNASAMYSVGRESREAVELARQRVSNALNCSLEEVYFTAGGSESDNMILCGIANAYKNKGRHIITSKIEHLAVINTCKKLEEEGFRITYLNVDDYGVVDLEELKSSICEDTILISIMFANSEIGTIEPIKEIGYIAKQHNICFHTDAVQAIGNVSIDVRELNICALSLSAHKFYGPKGVGAAYIKNEVEFTPLINGGHQEKNKRAGTENVPGIIGLGKAIELANQNIECYNEKLLCLRSRFIGKVCNQIPNIKINGHLENRLPGNINISIADTDSSTILLMLDMYGICASSGSACNTGSTSVSHVLEAIRLPSKYANSTLRFTLGEENTIEEVEYIVDSLAEIVCKIRNRI